MKNTVQVVFWLLYIAAIITLCVITLGYYYYKEEALRQRYAREISLATLNIVPSPQKTQLRILDLGAGKGEIADRLIVEGHHVTLLDIHKQHPLTQLYNGVDIPYSDGYFDLCVCSFVLHHTDQTERMISEMARVAKWLCILEDLPDQSPIPVWSRFLSYCHYWYFHQSGDMMKHMLSQDSWIRLFKKHRLKLISQTYLKPSIVYYVPHILFLLRSD